MNIRSTLLKLLSPLVVITLAVAAHAADLKQVVQKVDQKYNRLHTLETQFTEIYQGGGMDRTESGLLLLKKPGKMRWEYRSPREKLFLSDGKDAWFYLPGERQVRKTAMSKLDDLRSPLGFLLGKTRLEKELQGLSFAPDVTPLNQGDFVLRGVPKGIADRVSQIMLEVTPDGQIDRITLQQPDGSVTEYRFSGQKEDATIADSAFRFTPPPGTEVVEGDLGQ